MNATLITYGIIAIFIILCILFMLFFRKDSISSTSDDDIVLPSQLKENLLRESSRTSNQLKGNSSNDMKKIFINSARNVLKNLNMKF